MVQFVNKFFYWISSIFVGFLKSSRFFCVSLYSGAFTRQYKTAKKQAVSEIDLRIPDTNISTQPSFSPLKQIK